MIPSFSILFMDLLTVGWEIPSAFASSLSLLLLFLRSSEISGHQLPSASCVPAKNIHIRFLTLKGYWFLFQYVQKKGRKSIFAIRRTKKRKLSLNSRKLFSALGSSFPPRAMP